MGQVIAFAQGLLQYWDGIPERLQTLGSAQKYLMCCVIHWLADCRRQSYFCIVCALIPVCTIFPLTRDARGLSVSSYFE